MSWDLLRCVELVVMEEIERDLDLDEAVVEDCPVQAVEVGYCCSTGPH